MHFFKNILDRTKNLCTGGLKENIFFMHIPKCGGTSISHAIKRKYLTFDTIRTRIVSLDSEASFKAAKIFDYPTLKYRENLLLYFMNIDNVKYISGHFPFSEIAYNKFHDKYTFITVLREPIKRWISLYFYNRYKKKSDHKKIGTDLTNYIQSALGQTKGSWYVRYLCGGGNLTDYNSRQAIEKAKKNLDRFDLVGCLEYMDNFIRCFENRVGVRLALKNENLNPVTETFKNSVLTEEIIEKIKTICKPDLEIYQYAVDKFVKANYR